MLTLSHLLLCNVHSFDIVALNWSYLANPGQIERPEENILAKSMKHIKVNTTACKLEKKFAVIWYCDRCNKKDIASTKNMTELYTATICSTVQKHSSNC